MHYFVNAFGRPEWRTALAEPTPGRDIAKGRPWPKRARSRYDDWHIDGAVLWHVYQDLKDADYGLVETAVLESLVVLGDTTRSTVVFYGYARAMGFRLMTLYGHADVRILECSRETWRAEGTGRLSGNCAQQPGRITIRSESPIQP